MFVCVSVKQRALSTVFHCASVHEKFSGTARSGSGVLVFLVLWLGAVDAQGPDSLHSVLFLLFNKGVTPSLFKKKIYFGGGRFPPSGSQRPKARKFWKFER